MQTLNPIAGGYYEKEGSGELSSCRLENNIKVKVNCTEGVRA
jgi:hypothetical protein